jgi:hypothetical protein
VGSGFIPVFAPRTVTRSATRDEFEAAKAPHVLDTIADLLPLAGLSAAP